jgi:hypothetical protein
MSGAIPQLPQYAFVAWCSVKAQGQLYLLRYCRQLIVAWCKVCIVEQVSAIWNLYVSPVSFRSVSRGAPMRPHDLMLKTMFNVSTAVFVTGQLYVVSCIKWSVRFLLALSPSGATEVNSRRVVSVLEPEFSDMDNLVCFLQSTNFRMSGCFNWTPRHEGVLGERKYSSIHSLTSALHGGEWSASRSGRFTPRERAPGTHWIGGWECPVFCSHCFYEVVM